MLTVEILTDIITNSKYPVLAAREIYKHIAQICPWKPIEEAPKDTSILLDIGLPWAVVGIWNEPNQAWCYTEVQVDCYDGKWVDTYFENEHQETFYKDKKVVEWYMPLPKIKNTNSTILKEK